MKFNKIMGFGLLALGVSGASLGVANAQVYTPVPIMAPAPIACVSINANLRYGSTDYYTKGAVTQLQQFLAGQGYFSSVYLGTGRFGPITARAVVQYQLAHGITPVGVAGPITRASIYKETCGGIVVPPTHQAPGISGLSPALGPVGTQVTLSGYNFTSDNTVLFDGIMVASNVPAKSTSIVCITYPCQGSQSITITIPEYVSPYCGPGMYCIMMVRAITPGPHQISVQNQNGTSNVQIFTVTDDAGHSASVSSTITVTPLY